MRRNYRFLKVVNEERHETAFFFEGILRIYRDNYAADEYSFNRGKAEGLKEGQAAERTMIARNLKENGVDIQVIIHCTGLTKEQIDQL